MRDEDSKVLLSGNEAFARGALEAGIRFCASYPGTPSTEIATELFNYAKEYDIYVEWSVNEKVALEASAGASWAGIPALCSMKSLGLNVSADFLLNLNLSGSGPGGLVIVVCDDPRGHSSSNEQDSRFYAKASYLPLFEPATNQEAKDIMILAVDLSQTYQIPILVRSTTRLSHSKALVETKKVRQKKIQTAKSMPDRLYNVPNPHLRHRDLDDKTSKIGESLDEAEVNTIHNPDAETLIIGTGVGYRYGEEAAEIVGSDVVGAAKLVASYPLPLHTILRWLKGKKRVLFLEEVDPFVEEQILSLYTELNLYETYGPIEFFGKQNGYIPFYGELNTDIAVDALERILNIEQQVSDERRQEDIKLARDLLIPRPLTFCAGCTHRNVYWAIRKLRKQLKEKLVVAGDIGCYSLGVFYDEAMNTMQAMGSGIGTATGLGQLYRFGFDKKVIAVAGDSTFFHACIPGLINARHKNAELTFLILDNRTTAMTGFQAHPGSGIAQQDLTNVSIEKIVRAIEPDLFEVVDATDIDDILDRIHHAVSHQGLKVLLVRSICRLEEKKDPKMKARVFVDTDACRGENCRICVSEFACPALEWNNDSGVAGIIKYACTRCGSCIMVCPHDAIRREE